MCGHNGEFDDPMTGKCVICAGDPGPEKDHAKRGKLEYNTQFRNKTRWRADANIDLRKIEKVISLCRSLISELTELGIGPICVYLVGQEWATLNVAGEQFSFTYDGNLTVAGVGRDIRQGLAGVNIHLIENAKSFSVGTMARAVKTHLGRVAKAEEGDENGSVSSTATGRQIRDLEHGRRWV